MAAAERPCEGGRERKREAKVRVRVREKEAGVIGNGYFLIYFWVCVLIVFVQDTLKSQFI